MKPFSEVPQAEKLGIGSVFGYWTILKEAGRIGKNSNMYYVCHCKCGTMKPVKGSNLIKGTSRSCGCNLGTHRKSRTSEYKIYIGIGMRCNNARYTGYMDYGGRGIKCLFTSFEDFIREIGPRPSPKHSVDRIDVNGHYEPGNVKWSTIYEQLRNTRHTRRFKWNGKVQCLKDWAIELGLNPKTVYVRVHRGWTVPEALNLSPRCL